MHVVLETGVIFELDICASPATRLSVRQPERSSDLALCVTSRMISVTAIPLYEPPTFIGMENGNIQILPHKYCRMSFFHAHSCSVMLLSSPIDFNEIHNMNSYNNIFSHKPVHPDVIMSCGSDGLIVLWNVIHYLPPDLSAINLKLQAAAQLKLNFAPKYLKMVRNYLTVLSYEGDVQLWKKFLKKSKILKNNSNIISFISIFILFELGSNKFNS